MPLVIMSCMHWDRKQFIVFRGFSLWVFYHGHIWTHKLPLGCFVHRLALYGFTPPIIQSNKFEQPRSTKRLEVCALHGYFIFYVLCQNNARAQGVVFYLVLPTRLRECKAWPFYWFCATDNAKLLFFMGFYYRLNTLGNSYITGPAQTVNQLL